MTQEMPTFEILFYLTVPPPPAVTFLLISNAVELPPVSEVAVDHKVKHFPCTAKTYAVKGRVISMIVLAFADTRKPVISASPTIP